MKRGFKTESEQRAEELRRQLKLASTAPLPARMLASHLGVTVVGPEDIPGITPTLIHQLLVADVESWSATTISVGPCTIVIHNTAHEPGRQESDVMHELAHLLCEHRPSQIVRLEGFPFPLRTFDPAAEDEASWLGSSLQLPRAALWWGVRRGMSVDEFIDYFGVSAEMVRYRRRITGVDVQLGRRQASRRLGVIG